MQGENGLVIPFAITVAGANATATVRYWRKVDITDYHWLWKGAPTQSGGYGKFRIGGKDSPTLGAHIVSWSSVNGRMPEPGMEIHHVCSTRLCIRPDSDHLKELDGSEHMELHYARLRARETCVHGHDLTDQTNIYMHDGNRHCRACRRMNDRRRLGIPYDRWQIKDTW